jgi:hypothetical protein
MEADTHSLGLRDISALNWVAARITIAARLKMLAISEIRAGRQMSGHNAGRCACVCLASSRSSAEAVKCHSDVPKSVL